MLGALALFAASCEKEIETALPQVNPQEPILTTGDITVVPVGIFAETQPTINLEDYSAPGTQIKIMDPAETQNLPESASVCYKLELANNSDFKNSIIIDAPHGDAEATAPFSYVDAQTWNSAHVALFGRNPETKTVYYRIPVYVELDGSDYRYESTDYYCKQGTILENCMDPGFKVENAYYLISEATTLDFSSEAAVASYSFIHGSDADWYDDPVLSIKFKVSQDIIDQNGTCKWQIAPKSLIGTSDAAKLMGPQSDPAATEGFLVTENALKGEVSVAGKYLLTINLEKMTYTIELLLQPNLLYTPGDANGWNQLASAWLIKGGDGNYYGVSPIKGSFKICENTNWDDESANWGAESGDPANSGTLVAGNSGNNIAPEADGLYWIAVNFDSETDALTTYTLTELHTVNLMGSFAASGWANDVIMVNVTDADGNATGDWEADVTFAAGDTFKVRFDSSWDYNLGGAINALESGGADIKVEEAGTYTVTLHLLGGYPRITMEKN